VSERSLPDAHDPSESPVPTLPCAARRLVPHRPPMLLVERLLDKQDDHALVDAIAPDEGIFVDRLRGLAPEYFVEVIAQAMAAASGFDALEKGTPFGGGFLVGIDDCRWYGTAAGGETLRIELEKRFQFEAVTVMEGRVLGRGGCLASATVKVWETGKA
jgi:predicted hotdog family 3-hydroxylacyl-ACP dehydratase